MEAGKLNIIINKKATFRQRVYLLQTYDPLLPVDDPLQVPVDLTNAVATAKVKKKITDTAIVIALDATIPEPTKGYVDLYLSPAQTSSLNFETGVWDLFIAFGLGDVVKYLEGSVVLDKAVT